MNHAAPRTFERLAIFGAGGHGRELAWLASQAWGDDLAIDFLVDRQEYLRDAVDGHPVSLLQAYEVRGATAFVVALGDAAHRRRAAEACTARGLMPVALVHPRVEASSRVEIAPGAVVCAGSVLTTNVRIGAHAHVNIACTLSHDTVLGDFATLSPGVHVAGHVHIGRDVFVGIGATIINGEAGNPLVIGEGAVIAAGACVISNVPTHSLFAGVPARFKRSVIAEA